MIVRELLYSDKEAFINAMVESEHFHRPLIDSPKTDESFDKYFDTSQSEMNKTYLAFKEDELVGVFNISGIIRGCFHSAYLGYCANQKFAGRGLMSVALKLVLEKIFLELKLHRIEANIQPVNTPSILLVTRNGFMKEGFSQRYLKINGQWLDHFRFALTYEDWEANR